MEAIGISVPAPASAASCGAPSPGLRDAAVPFPPLCAAPACAAPALASAQVSPPAAGRCTVTQSHVTQTHSAAPSLKKSASQSLDVQTCRTVCD